MPTKLILELTNEQAVGLIALAARTSISVEEQVLYLIDEAILEADCMPAVRLEDLLADLRANMPEIPSTSDKSLVSSVS